MKKANIIKDESELAERDYSKSGRTDKFVSSSGNVISLFIDLEPDKFYLLTNRLNGRLPDDIIILGQCEVPNDFSARFQTIEREYHFYFESEGLNIKSMQIAASYLVGHHNFKNFCKWTEQYAKSGTTRKIFAAEVENLFEQTDGNVSLHFSRLKIRGSGFLWHQVNINIED
jgi:tRNA pseudouridine(38-40) synthase